jgi:hypothetical protein
MVSVAGASWRVDEVWAEVLSPGVGLASGAEGGGVLEVPCLAGDTVDVSFPNFICQEKSRLIRVNGHKGAQL